MDEQQPHPNAVCLPSSRDSISVEEEPGLERQIQKLRMSVVLNDHFRKLEQESRDKVKEMRRAMNEQREIQRKLRLEEARKLQKKLSSTEGALSSPTS